MDGADEVGEVGDGSEAGDRARLKQKRPSIQKQRTKLTSPNGLIVPLSASNAGSSLTHVMAED
jgi:hypothetical protein